MTDDDVTGAPAGKVTAAELGDADLVLRARSGDRSAFGELWRRHSGPGLIVASAVTSDQDAETLVEQAFARIYGSIVTGGGPAGSFRAHLFTSIRLTAAEREETARGTDAPQEPATGDQSAAQALDGTLTHRAFSSLPGRWQEVLWYSDIEHKPPTETAPLLGMSSAAVAHLTTRAQEGLREAWIEAHLNSVADDSDCRWSSERLGAFARHELARRDHARLDAHLAVCARCSIVAGEAEAVSRRLALVLLPLSAGISGSAAYLASLPGGGVPIAPLATMPDAVMQPPVHAAAGAVDDGVGWSESGAIGYVTFSHSAGRGILPRVGAAAGLVAAAVLVVGGVAAAAVVLPALSPSSTVAEAPSESPSIGGSDDQGTGDPESVRSSPRPSDLPTTTESLPPADEDGTSDPVGDTDPADASTPNDPGTANPGAGDPSPPTDPGSTVFGLPSGAPTITGSSASVSPATGEVTLSIEVSGTPGATVQVRIRGSVVDATTVGDSGAATLTVQPSGQDVATNARIEVRYAAGDRLGPPTGAFLSDLLA